MSILRKYFHIFLITVVFLLIGTICMIYKRVDEERSIGHKVGDSYLLCVTGHIVSIDEEVNTFQLRVLVEDGSERVLTVHFGEKPVSGVLVNVSDYKIGDRVTISYFPYDRKGSYIDADSIEIFDEQRDRVWEDEQTPKIHTDKREHREGS
ncbi:hypothetical protein [Lancefieldella sp. Marseille-Q7238]|uniref:hypothetical protein n=1 Tax=Lancefieldella sp. Marseille-Q7238 TaxID=3022127 RepID=UPI0024A88DAD|nr:hypothetical protein [Lancefieldella sp. Marseille-Q7238]